MVWPNLISKPRKLRAQKEGRFIPIRELLPDRAERKFPTLDTSNPQGSRRHGVSNLELSRALHELKGQVSPPGGHGSQYDSKDGIVILTVKFSFGDFSFLITCRFLIPLSRGMRTHFFMEPMSTLNKGAGTVFVNGDIKWAGKWTQSLIIFSTQGAILTLSGATNSCDLLWDSVAHSTLGHQRWKLLKSSEPPRSHHSPLFHEIRLKHSAAFSECYNVALQGSG